MRSHRIVVTIVLVAIWLPVVTVAVATPSAAGGGCHSTFESGQTESTGDRVAFEGNCVVPTVLRVARGSTVTFVNEDQHAHVVTGTGWGFFDHMNHQQTYAARFDRDGTFPFSCYLHPGMNGAVVVGSGQGGTGRDAVVELAASTATTSASAPVGSSAAPDAAGAPATAVAATPASAVTDGATPRTGVATGAAVALLVAGLVAGVSLRRRATASARQADR